MYMANASPNARRPNATYIPPARVGLLGGRVGLLGGRVGLLWGRVGLIRGRVGSARFFRYQHVGIPNAKSSC